MASAPGRKPLSLFDTPAGFDDPLEMLVGCHRRVEKQLQTLKRLREHLQSRGVDAEATSAALQASLDLRDNGGQRPDDN